MLILYVVAGFLGALVSVIVTAQSGWLVAVVTAPLVASTLALAIAGISSWAASRRSPASAGQIPAGVVWC